MNTKVHIIQYRNENTAFEWRDAPGYYNASVADRKVKELEQANRGYAKGNPQLTTEYRVSTK